MHKFFTRHNLQSDSGGNTDSYIAHSGNTALISGAILFQTVALSYILAAVTMLFGGVISCWMFPAAFLVSVAVSICFSPGCYRRVKALAVPAILIAVSVAVASFFEDNSYDGNWYHQEGVAAMLGGWNPYHMADSMPLSVWAIHYANGIETSAAVLSSFTGHIESGKAMNLLMLFATGLIVYSALRRSTDCKKSAIIAVFAVCNPVCITQMLTFYIDYAKYLYLLIALSALCRIYTCGRQKINWIMLSEVIIFAIATKFNAFFEMGVIISVALVAFWVQRKHDIAVKLLIVGALSAIVGTLVLGYHPYITNWISKGHPLYPLLGTGNIDIMTSNTPDVLQGVDRFSAFFKSLFSFKLASYDTRVGGFGPFMPLMFVASVIVFGYYRRSISKWVWLIVACVIASCFFFEQSWWTRYTCQLWLFPTAALYELLTQPHRNRFNRVLCYILLAAGAVNTASCITVTFVTTLNNTYKRHYIYRNFNGATIRAARVDLQTLRHLSEHDINVEEVSADSLDLDKCVDFYPGFTTLQLTEEDLDNIESISLSWYKRFSAWK